MLSKIHTLIIGYHSLLGIKDVVYSQLLRAWRLGGNYRSACMVQHMQFSHASLDLPFPPLNLCRSQFWGLGIFPKQEQISGRKQV